MFDEIIGGIESEEILSRVMMGMYQEDMVELIASFMQESAGIRLPEKVHVTWGAALGAKYGLLPAPPIQEMRPEQTKCAISWGGKGGEKKLLSWLTGGLKEHDVPTDELPSSADGYARHAKIRDASFLILVLSAESAEDPHLMEDMAFALDNRMQVFPVADNTEFLGKISTGLSMAIKKFQWTIFDQADADGRKNKLVELVGGIRRAALVNEASHHHDAFISWAHKDAAMVKDKIYPALQKAKLDVWIDANQLRSGASWRDEIGKGILNSQCLLFAVSRTSVASRYCSEELNLAYDEGTPIVLLRIDDDSEVQTALEKAPGIKMLLNNCQHSVDFYETDFNEAMSEVTSLIASLKPENSSKVCAIM